jgi:hypothetical protein
VAFDERKFCKGIVKIGNKFITRPGFGLAEGFADL